MKINGKQNGLVVIVNILQNIFFFFTSLQTWIKINKSTFQTIVYLLLTLTKLINAVNNCYCCFMSVHLFFKERTADKILCNVAHYSSPCVNILPVVATL